MIFTFTLYQTEQENKEGKFATNGIFKLQETSEGAIII